jgi:hypothetical protein
MSTDKAQMFLSYWRLLADGLDEPTPEYVFAPPRKWRLDFAFVPQHVAVEVEGNAWAVPGGGRHMQDKDLEKYNAAASEGWRLFRFSPGMLERDPDTCVDMVARAVYGFSPTTLADGRENG